MASQGLSLSLCVIPSTLFAIAALSDRSGDRRMTQVACSRVIGSYDPPPPVCDPQLMAWGGCATGVPITACPSPPCPTDPLWSCNTDCTTPTNAAGGGSVTTNGSWDPVSTCSDLFSVYYVGHCTNALPSCTCGAPLGLSYPCKTRTSATYTTCKDPN